MQIQHKELHGNGVFYIEKDGEAVAKMTYQRDNDRHITVLHTEVDDVLRGKGAGKQLLSALVDWARHSDVKVTPQCSFARSLFERISEFQSVLSS